MQYTPHSHSALIDGTVAALLWEAADYLASEPETPVDPLSRIGDGALKAGRITTTIYFAAVDLAIHVTIADCPDTNRDFDWANWGDWYHGLNDPHDAWHVLAKAANLAARIAGHENSINPGRWTP